MLSPKGGFRMLGVLLVGFLLINLGMFFDPQQLVGWVTTTIVKLGTALVAISLWYYVGRRLMHIRTHELDKSKDTYVYWNIALMISSALVFNGALGL